MLAQIYNQIDTAIKWVDDRIWGLPLIILILTTGIYLTVRLGGLQIRHLPKALRFMVKNEEEGHGEVTSFGALCTALSATIGPEILPESNCDCGRRTGRTVLDGGGSIFRNGNEVCRRASCNQIPDNRQRRACSWRTVLLY